MDVLVGSAISLRVELQGPSGTLIPDAGSLTYRVFDHTGQIVAGPTLVVSGPTTSFVDVPLPANLTTITPPRRFERRTVVVMWSSNGRPYMERLTARVIPFLNMGASPALVRSALGVADDELLDDEIDLLSAYLTIEAIASAELLEAALTSGTNLEMIANSAIVAQAALDILPTLPARMLASKTDGVVTAARFNSASKIEALRDDLVMRRDGLLLAINGDTTVISPIIVSLTSPVDVITGQAS